jgi:hypothetical protein
MKLTALLLFTFVAGPAQIRNRWSVMETARIINSAGARDDFTVESNRSSDDSPRIHIDWRGHRALTVQPEGGLVRVADAVKWARGLPSNRLSSAWVYSPKFSSRAGENFYLMFGWAFASDPGSLRIVRIRADGKPQLVYSDDTFLVDAIAEDTDGLELAGRRSLSEAMGGCLTTYDPFTVIRLRRDRPPKPSVALSRKYNLSHGYVWAGPKPREDLRVDSCAKPTRLVGKSNGDG